MSEKCAGCFCHTHGDNSGNFFMNKRVTIDSVTVAALAVVKVLEQLEWDGYDYLGNPTCPVCAQRQTVGHYPDCELSAAIKKAKGQ